MEKQKAHTPAIYPWHELAAGPKAAREITGRM